MQRKVLVPGDGVMSIYQLNMYGMDKVQTAIKRLQMFEPPDGYYRAFGCSGHHGHSVHPGLFISG